jgi:hypothetical protein
MPSFERHRPPPQGNAMKNHLVLIAIAGALTFSLKAEAGPVTSYDWGTHDEVESASVQPIGKFDTTFLFLLTQDVDLYSSAVSNNLHRPTDLKGGLVSLFTGTGLPDDILLGSYAFDGATGGVLHAFGWLTAGQYVYRVSSMGTGENGGAYTINSMITLAPVAPAFAAALQVPEPASLALTLLAFGAMGATTRRRKAA